MTQTKSKKKLREFCKKWRINDFGYPSGVDEIKLFDVIHNLVLLIETAINKEGKSKGKK